ncbi:MAG: peroxiredoxin [Gammaproteobacteria bacterium]
MPSNPLITGDTLKPFQVQTTGTPPTLTEKDLQNQWTVLYFYPRDDTPGCTVEANDFTALAADFGSLNAKVIGVSADTLASHDKFINKHNLNLTLISDADKSFCNLFGAIVEKNMYGRKYMGIDRCTFLINPELQIVAEWRKVKAKGHAAKVLETLQDKAQDSA